MSGFGMSVDIIGNDKGVQMMLNRLDTALNPIAIAGFLGAEIGPYLQQRAKARFAGEGDDVSGKWLPLRESTQNFRRAGREQQQWSVGDSHPINVRTHELENYITGNAGTVAPSPVGTVLRFPEASRKRSIQEKMKTAQRGKRFPPTPRRPVLGLNERDYTFILTELAFHIKGR